MKKIISVFMVFVLLVTVAMFTSCKKRRIEGNQTTSSTQPHSKGTTAQAVEIVEIPESLADRVDMFNGVLNYVDDYCYVYTKNIKCDVANLSLGKLSAASNAADAFKSIFGMTNTTNEYSYKATPESFAENFIKERFSESDVASADAKQEGKDIILKITFKNETNPTEDGRLNRLSSEYMNPSKVMIALNEFASSAGSVNVSATNITATATINASDSSPKKLVISYTEDFTLSDVKLVQLEESLVTGRSKTVITYSGLS